MRYVKREEVTIRERMLGKEMELGMKIIESTLNGALQMQKANFVERVEYERKHKPSKLLLEKRETLKEKKEKLQEKKEKMCEKIKELQGGEEVLGIIEAIYKLCDMKEKKKEHAFFELDGREEYSETEYDDIFLMEWKDNPSFILVLKIFSIYYEFSIRCNNIERFLELEDSFETPRICKMKVSTLDRYNRGELSNEALLVIAALLYVVDSEKENRKKLEIFPEFNKMIDKERYDSLQDVIEKVEYVYELYKGEKEFQEFLKKPKNEKITFLDEVSLAFVYVTKMELQEWERFEIEKEKYNTACKLIFFGKNIDTMLGDGDGKKIKRFRKENKAELEKLEEKDLCFENTGYDRIKVEICEASALFCSYYKNECEIMADYYENSEWEIEEEKEFRAKIKEELAKIDDYTRYNVINNMEFISMHIDDRIEKLVNAYLNLNE